MSGARMRDLAVAVRSKNAGPFELTLDVFFKDRECFERARSSDAVAPDRIAALYNVPERDVLGTIWFEPALALKITLRRRVPSAAVGDGDVFGAQQHVPLMELELGTP